MKRLCDGLGNEPAARAEQTVVDERTAAPDRPLQSKIEGNSSGSRSGAACIRGEILPIIGGYSAA